MPEGSNGQMNKISDKGKELEKICINLSSLVPKPEIFYLFRLTVAGNKVKRKIK